MSVAEAASEPAFAPGVRYDLAHDDYLRLPALGSSDIKRILRSPAHYRAAADDTADAADALLFGTAVHMGAFEPARFEREVVALPDVDRRTKAGKAEHDAFVLAHPGALLLPAADLERARRVVAALHEHSAAAHLLRDGVPEVSLQWVDEATGAPCKARVDWLRPDGSMVDLKTARDASPLGFGRAIGQYGYAIQDAHYSAGGTVALRQRPPYFAFIAAEKDPPYAVGVYVLDDEAVAAAEARRRGALERWAECTRTGRWPAYSDLIETITLPKWAL